jgi:hypothetical protein
MRHARRHLDDVAGAGQACAQPEPEPHLALDDLEALGLDRMDVCHGHRAAGPQRKVEGQQLAICRGGGMGEGEALAGDRV